MLVKPKKIWHTQNTTVLQMLDIWLLSVTAKTLDDIIQLLSKMRKENVSLTEEMLDP
jgi:hypothetical protein